MHVMKSRYAPRMSVQCRVVFQSEAGVGEGRTLNLSLLGATVETPNPVRLGRQLRVNVFLPDTQPSLKVIQAAVKWVAGQQFGVEFIRLSEKEEERLIRFLTTHPDPAPQSTPPGN